MKIPTEARIVPQETRSGTQVIPQCAFTVDVEDWYQSSVDFDAPISDRVVKNVHTVLEFLDEFHVQGTFFVQGLVAARFPDLIQAIADAGHEIQSHGHTHRPLYSMDQPALKRELDRARKSVEDACGIKVTAFRAPDFSILESNLWALEVLAEAGFEVDSSVFPVRMKRYGISGSSSLPHKVPFDDGSSILEVPVAIWNPGPFKIPIAGGGYFRLLPGPFLELAISKLASQHHPVVLYCHPYEFNPHELDDLAPNVSRRFAFTQKLGRASMISRLRGLFKKFEFGRFDRLVAEWRKNENSLSNNG